MHTIETLHTYVENKLKDNVPLSELVEYIEKSKIAIEPLKKYIKINTTHYNKINLIQGDKCEFILLCWNSDQSAPLHDHADNGCIMKCLEGELHEQRYDENKNQISSSDIHANQTAFIKNTLGYHSIRNKTYTPTISLHVYSPKNHVTKYL